MYKVRRPVDTNDATRGFWPRYQEPGPLTFLQGVRTLLGPLALLLRPPGIATNLQSLNAEKEAGALSTPWQTQCNEAMPWSGKHGLITRVYLLHLELLNTLSNLLFLFPWSFMLLPTNRFPTAAFSRL